MWITLWISAARHHGGDFILRVEDTDQARKVPGAVKYIMEGFEWFGIDIDEGPTREELEAVDGDIGEIKGIGGAFGPYIQSMRKERHAEIVEKLIESGHAFRCDCTPEMLEKERAEQSERKEVPGYAGRCRERQISKDTRHVVRFKMPQNPNIEIEDGVRGKISWESVPLRDPVLVKSDGFPTYHLANVVDDHDMEISHVLRGEEWIPSTPLHVLLYEALGWEQPIFCHLPVINGPDGKKLSKRHGSTSWSSFRDESYLPQAVLNFIALIGWSPGEGVEQEKFSKEELIELFSIEKVNSSSGVFDYTKLKWMNGLYLKELPRKEFDALVKPELERKEIHIPEERWDRLATQIQERVKMPEDVLEVAGFLQDAPLERDLEAMLSKKLDREGAKKVLGACASAFADLHELSEESVETALKQVAEQLEIKAGMVFLPVRIAVTGKKNTPPLTDSLLALGKEEVVKRLREAEELL